MVATTCPGSMVSPSSTSTVFSRPAYFAAMSTSVASSRPLPLAKPGGSLGLESSHQATPPPTTATTANAMRSVFLDMKRYPCAARPPNYDGRLAMTQRLRHCPEGKVRVDVGVGAAIVSSFAPQSNIVSRSDIHPRAQGGNRGSRQSPHSKMSIHGPAHPLKANHPQPAAGFRSLLGPVWLRDYHRDWLKPDVIAGLTAAAVVIPQALAYATVAGLPVEVGLYTAFLPMLIYAWLGTSRPLSVSTTATLAILTGTALGRVVPRGDGANLLVALPALTLLVGAALVVAALLRLGFVANFISDPVLTGFKAGIGVVIVFNQLPKLLGIHITKGSFLHNLASMWTALPQSSIATLTVGAVSIGMLLGMQRLWPRVPAPLVVVATAIAAVSLLSLPHYGVETVGHIPTGLPSLTAPDLSQAAQLLLPAVAIALMSFTETVAAGRAFAAADEPAPAANRELLATGLANAGGALLGAMPAGGGTTQTTVNRRAGARTQLAEIITATVTLATILLLAPILAFMPQATLAAVVVVYSIGLIQPAEFRAILK